MDKKGKIALMTAVVLVAILVIGLAFAKPGGKARKACNDGIDNDGDGYIDLNDPGCANKRDNSELDPNVECDDGADNDGDSAIDYNDNGCSSPTDNDESDCGDGVCEGTEACDACVADCGICDSCSDTDGWNPNTQGTISGYDDNAPYSNTDFCLDSMNVVEYWCSGVNPANSTVECMANMSQTCVNGACV